jgi:two-component system response regulator NreC
MSPTINYIFAEDQTLFRKSLIVLLRKHGFKCMGEAQSGHELLSLMKNKRPDFLLLAMQMPNIDGVPVFERVRKLYPYAKIIVLATHYNEDIRECSYNKGASAFVPKNIDDKIAVEIFRSVYYNTYKWGFTSSPDESMAGDCYGEKLNLTPRELEVLTLVYKGFTNKEIASQLNVVVKTIEAHKKKLYLKTKVSSSTEFIRYIESNGLGYLR